MNWFYEYNGEQKGPVTESELDSLIAQGVVLPTTLVWRDGLTSWTPLARVRPARRRSAASRRPRAPRNATRADASSTRATWSRSRAATSAPAANRPCCKASSKGCRWASLSDPTRTGPAWEHRQTLGMVAAAYQTVVAVLSKPSETFATMRVDGGITEPFLFNLGVGGISMAVRVVYFAIAQSLGMSFNPMLKSQDVFLAGGGMMVMIVVQVIAAFIGTAISSFIYAGVFHVCLMMFGGARRSFETTFRVICYGGGAVTTLNLIPIIGTIVSLPWLLVAWIIGLARAHETDLWRAVLAVLLPFVLCCIAMIAFFALMIGIVSKQGIH